MGRFSFAVQAPPINREGMVPCRHCGRPIPVTRGALTRHEPRCPRRPEIWRRILAVFREHGAVPVNGWDRVAPASLPRQ